MRNAGKGIVGNVTSALGTKAPDSPFPPGPHVYGQRVKGRGSPGASERLFLMFQECF